MAEVHGGRLIVEVLGAAVWGDFDIWRSHGIICHYPRRVQDSHRDSRLVHLVAKWVGRFFLILRLVDDH